jgi:hypothetical protein
VPALGRCAAGSDGRNGFERSGVPQEPEKVELEKESVVSEAWNGKKKKKSFVQGLFNL